MIYMVEIGLPAEFVAPFEEYFLYQVRRLLQVPGFTTAQRFIDCNEAPRQFLQIYSIASPEVMESDHYRTVGGPTQPGTRPFITELARRNLYDGVEFAPSVADNEYLLVLDDPDASQHLFPDIRFDRLFVKGLDKSVPHRSIAVVTDRNIAKPHGTKDIRLFRPVTQVLKSRASANE